MAKERTFLRGRVERRLLALFLACALVPTGVLAFLAFDRVSDQLYEQSERRLHQASKATALAVLGRLLTLESDLTSLSSDETLEGRLVASVSSRRVDRLRTRFEAIAFLPDQGTPVDLLGDLGMTPALSHDERAHLRTGKTLLATHRRPDGSPRVLLHQRTALESGVSGLLVGDAKIAFLLDISTASTLPPGSEFCVLDEAYRPMACSIEGPVTLEPNVLAAIERSPSGRFEWSHGDAEYLAGYWSVFLEPNFLASSWTLILSEPRATVLAPVAEFRTVYPAAAITCFIIVAGLCIHQIRKHLQPLEKLHEGTRHIAEGHFDVVLDVDSGDEFQVLAESFNAMAGRLRKQFDTLGKMIDVDRAILSSLDDRSIAATVHDRIREIYDCDFVIMLLAQPGSEDTLQASAQGRSSADDESLVVSTFSPMQAEELRANREHHVVHLANQCPHYLRSTQDAGMEVAVVLPLFIKEALCGAIVVAHRDASRFDPDALIYARQVADQAAVSLANAFAREENRNLAYYDHLTGLPNRLLFRDLLDQACQLARRHQSRVATCLLDVDGFKRINDTLGQGAGDQLLRQVAERIGWTIGSGRLARMGGDEFAIVFGDLAGIEDPARAAQAILDELSRPFQLEAQQVFISASIGIAIFPVHSEDVETVLRSAELAMSHAKREGGNRYCFFTDSMKSTATDRLDLENALRRALERNEFRIHYQPVVDVASRDIIAMEALIRWQHPEIGLIFPAEFIPVAEETGLIVPIGEWVLRTACEANRRWQAAGLPHLRVAVNLSSRQIEEPTLISMVRRALSDSGLHAQYLSLELTESILMSANEATQHTLREFQELGVRLCIDDFGTGYSSLAYLKHFPVEQLKIDQSFIKDVTTDSDDAAIVRAVIAMANSLKLQVVAEGVETEGQLGWLREAGCEAAQGHLFSEAVPSDAFEKLLRDTGSA